MKPIQSKGCDDYLIETMNEESRIKIDTPLDRRSGTNL